MANKKFDYDSPEFYEDIFGFAMQGFTDAEIADNLCNEKGENLTPEVFYTMKNGNYSGWNEEENKERGERISKVLARARRKVNSIVRGTYLKAAIGGKKIKSSSTTTRKIRLPDGTYANEDEVQTTDSEHEMPPNIQALSTWLYHHDKDWRKAQQQRDDTEESSNGSIEIDKWIEDNTTENAEP